MNRKTLAIRFGKALLIAALLAAFNGLPASAQARPQNVNYFVPAVVKATPGNLDTAFVLAKADKPDKEDKDKNKHKDTGPSAPVALPDGGNTLLLLGAAFLGVALAGWKFKGMLPRAH